MITQLWLDPAFSTRLCFTLLHSLWQMALLALIAWGLDRLWRRCSVERSYLVHVGALLVGLAALPITAALVEAPAPAVLTEPDSAVASEAGLASSTTLTVPRTPASESAHASVPPSNVGSEPVDAVPVASAVSATIPSAVSAPDPAGDWQRVAAWVVAVYAMGVLAMLARLAHGLWCAHRLATNTQPLRDGPVAKQLQSLASQWSMRITPALAVAERVVVPTVVGLLQPTILLPASAVTALSTDELRMILAHELAHIRRHDLWVNLLQRLAETVLFFNPALWYLSHRMSSLREFCCDELTCRAISSSSSGPRARYAAALLRVALLSQRASSELASLAATGRSPSDLRRRIAHLVGEPLREPLRLSRGCVITIAGLLALLIIGSIVRRPMADSAPPKESEAASTNEDRFELLVVGPDGKPAPRALVGVRTKPAPTAKQIVVGEYVRATTIGPFVRTNAAGRLVIQLPREQPRGFNLNITTAGYGPYWATWGADETIPSRFVAELDAARSIGGIVVDGDGSPIAGVRIRPDIEFKKRPTDYEQIGIRTSFKTDESGKWRFDSVPVSMGEVFVEISHPDFKPERWSLTRDQFGLRLDQQPVTKIELQRGLTVTGRVIDKDGLPIAGALLRTKFFNALREAKTDANGEYRLTGGAPAMAKIVVSAQGRATDMKELRIGPDLEPVDFRMQPGGKVRIRVLDENGKPVPKARISFQGWRGSGFDHFEFDDVDRYADENGVWEWKEAPLDEFQVDISPLDGMQLGRQSIVARDKEYVFRLPPTLVISGSVVDKKTREPIKNFRVVPGIRSSADHMNWVRWNGFVATDGAYRIQHRHDYFAHLLRIEADGYELAVSRDVKSNEGNVRIDFELTPARGVAATVLTPDGQPAARSKVALGVAGSQIVIQNGALDDTSTRASRRDADEEGRFAFPAQNSAFQLVITHSSGFAHLKSNERKIPSTIRLTPWARVEGIYRIGSTPVANAGMRLVTYTIRSIGKDVPSIFTRHNVTTGTDGRFVFERVFPGKGWIGRRIHPGVTEAMSSMQIGRRFPAGETTTLDLGGDGRAVVGKLVPANETGEPALWNFARVRADVDVLPPPSPTPPPNVRNNAKLRKAWWEAWKALPEGKIWQSQYDAYRKLRDESPYFTATVDGDGAFRIDDVPPGNYKLGVRFDKHSAGKLSGHRFTVPASDRLTTAPPLDLGRLQLK